jgi:Tfp pilus assembly protein FimT
MAINRLSQSTAQSAFPKFTNFWDGTTATSSFDSIGSVLLSANASTITFSNIPQTYTHLQIRMFARYTGSVGSGYIAFNGDNSSGNYSYHGTGTDGVTPPPGSVAATSQNQGKYTGYAGTSPAEVNNGIIDILDYTNTSKYKTAKIIYCWDANGTGYVEFGSTNWRSTSAITSIVLTPANTFTTYTTVSLYGVK